MSKNPHRAGTPNLCWITAPRRSIRVSVQYIRLVKSVRTSTSPAHRPYCKERRDRNDGSAATPAGRYRNEAFRERRRHGRGLVSVEPGPSYLAAMERLALLETGTGSGVHPGRIAVPRHGGGTRESV